MEKYDVKISPKALQDLDEIYTYIAEELQVPYTAAHLIQQIEDAILGLESFPERGVLRYVSPYDDLLFRLIFVKNYTVAYRVDEKKKQVIVMTVYYSKRVFGAIRQN